MLVQVSILMLMTLTLIIISEKLSHNNYTTWARFMHLSIGGSGKLNHITASPPSKDSTEFNELAQDDYGFTAKILSNISPELVSQFLHYPSAKPLWEGLELLYSSKQDLLQIYDLTIKANNLKQKKDTIESFFRKLTAIWQELDRRIPNPMTSPTDFTTYNEIQQKNWLYQFVSGLNNTYVKDRREHLNRDKRPTAEEAYATIQREIVR